MRQDTKNNEAAGYLGPVKQSLLVETLFRRHALAGQ